MNTLLARISTFILALLSVRSNSELTFIGSPLEVFGSCLADPFTHFFMFDEFRLALDRTT